MVKVHSSEIKKNSRVRGEADYALEMANRGKVIETGRDNRKG